jgi:hypothetical protein
MDPRAAAALVEMASAVYLARVYNASQVGYLAAAFGDTNLNVEARVAAIGTAR